MYLKSHKHVIINIVVTIIVIIIVIAIIKIVITIKVTTITATTTTTIIIVIERLYDTKRQILNRKNALQNRKTIIVHLYYTFLLSYGLLYYFKVEL